MDRPDSHDYARAVAQWLIGSAEWADILRKIEEADDPRQEAARHFRDYPEELDVVLTQVADHE